MEHFFDIAQIKALSIENKAQNYVSGVRKLCAEKLRVVAVDSEHSFSVNNATFEIDGENRRCYNFQINRRWDIITDFCCEVLINEWWTPLDSDKVSLLADESVVVGQLSPEKNILPMCTQFADLQVRLQLGLVVPLFFRVRYTGHLLDADERRLWISRDFDCDGLRYSSGVVWAKEGLEQ